MGWEMKSIDKHISFISLIVNHSLRNSKEIATKDNTKNPKRGPKVWTEEETSKGRDEEGQTGRSRFSHAGSSLDGPGQFPHNLQMKGDRIRAPFDLGWRIFTIKVLRFHVM